MPNWVFNYVEFKDTPSKELLDNFKKAEKSRNALETALNTELKNADPVLIFGCKETDMFEMSSRNPLLVTIITPWSNPDKWLSLVNQKYKVPSAIMLSLFDSEENAELIQYNGDKYSTILLENDFSLIDKAFSSKSIQIINADLLKQIGSHLYNQFNIKGPQLKQVLAVLKDYKLSELVESVVTANYIDLVKSFNPNYYHVVIVIKNIKGGSLKTFLKRYKKFFIDNRGLVEKLFNDYSGGNVFKRRYGLDSDVYETDIEMEVLDTNGIFSKTATIKLDIKNFTGKGIGFIRSLFLFGPSEIDVDYFQNGSKKYLFSMKCVSGQKCVKLNKPLN